jgi:DNA primase
VSTPVTWDEVRDALESGDPTRLEFEAPDVLARVEDLGDLYEDNVTLEQHLPEVGRR